MAQLKELETKIKKARMENEHGKMFVPHSRVERIISREEVKEALNDTSIERADFDNIVEVVCAGGHQVFAVLVLCGCPGYIYQFIASHNPNRSKLDDDLPLDAPTLQKLQIDEEYIDDICEKQWLFMTPVFDFEIAIPQLLHKRTVLPFLSLEDGEDGHLGSGGFGDIHVCRIPEEHQKIPYEIVRKEFKTDKSTEDSFARERLNMAILRHIQHPNIARLLGAYCHQGKYNFLFRKANGGNLGKLILCENRPKELGDDTSLLIALAGLSSAISAVHGISPEKIDMIGCHRDLRLSNVLVDGPRFILADFGLSRFKQNTENSGSSPTFSHGHYVSPECHEVEDGGFAREMIGRSSDIWSFGCLISEFVTYLLRKPKGVEKFRESRKINVAALNYTHYRFYESPEKENPGVQDWLDDLDKEAHQRNSPLGRAAQGMIVLVRKMLQLVPENRPNALEVEQKLRTIAVYSLSEQLSIDLQIIWDKSESVHALLAQKRFHAWLWATKIGAADESQYADGWTGESFTKFESICNHFSDLQKALRPLLHDNTQYYLREFLPLRDLGDRLFDLLPDSLREKAKQYAEISMLQYSDLWGQGDSYLRDVSAEFDKKSSLESLVALAKMKRMSNLESRRRRTLDLDLGLKCTPQKIGSQVGQMKLKPRPDLPDETVVVDTKEHGIKFSDKFLERLENLAQSLHSMKDPEGYHLLHCLGFFHDSEGRASSLVYRFPRPSLSRDPFNAMETLDSVLNQPFQYPEPDLDEKFCLAHGLALSLLQFHKTAWLHRSIRSTNIVFFLRRNTKWDPRDFYFVGLAHSRENDKTVITEGIHSRQKIDYYVDPRYLKSERFEITHDHYALGMVLLEIGLWQTVSDAFEEEWKHGVRKPEVERDKIFEKLVPRLGPKVGKLYKSAVMACLRGNFGSAAGLNISESDSKVACQLGFASTVVEPLSKCLA